MWSPISNRESTAVSSINWRTLLVVELPMTSALDRRRLVGDWRRYFDHHKFWLENVIDSNNARFFSASGNYRVHVGSLGINRLSRFGLNEHE